MKVEMELITGKFHSTGRIVNRSGSPSTLLKVWTAPNEHLEASLSPVGELESHWLKIKPFVA